MRFLKVFFFIFCLSLCFLMWLVDILHTNTFLSENLYLYLLFTITVLYVCSIHIL